MSLAGVGPLLPGSTTRLSLRGATPSAPGVDALLDLARLGVQDLFGVAVADNGSGHTVYAVGEDHAAYVSTDGGSSWNTVTVSGGLGTSDLLDVQTWGTGTSAIAVGQQGEIFLRSSGGAFNLVSTGIGGATETLTDVEVIGAGAELWIAGDRGRVLHYDGSAWSSPKSESTHTIYRLAFPSSSHGLGVARNFGIVAYY